MLLPPLVPNILFFHYSFQNSLVIIKYLPEITTFVKFLGQLLVNRWEGARLSGEKPHGT
jgi:hypothetical protein